MAAAGLAEGGVGAMGAMVVVVVVAGLSAHRHSSEYKKNVLRPAGEEEARRGRRRRGADTMIKREKHTHVNTPLNSSLQDP